MPVLPNAEKALRASKRKAKVNRKIKSNVKTALKKMQQDPSQKNLETAYSAIDKAVKKNVYHKNKGARLKSQVAKLLEEKGAKKSSPKKSKSKSKSKKSKKSKPKTKK